MTPGGPASVPSFNTSVPNQNSKPNTISKPNISTPIQPNNLSNIRRRK